MATVGGYHLFALPPESVREESPEIEFTTLDNDLSDGFYASTLFGSNNGVRTFKLKLPTLAGLSVLPNTVIGINGEAVSREQYFWDLFCESKVTGLPFVYLSKRDAQYYLVRFADKKLSYEGMRVRLYSTGVELNQVRVNGATVFDPTLLSYFDPGAMATPSGDVIAGPTQNGHATQRLNSVGTNGLLTFDLYPFGLPNWYDIFLVIKCREVVFGQTSGIFTDNSGASTIPRVLIGANGGTVFTDLSLTDFQYKLNGIEYPQAAMPAPMLAFGLIHLRFLTGLPAPNAEWQIGQDRAVANTKAEIDVAAFLAFDGLLPLSSVRELTEHLIVKYAIV